MRRVSLVLFFVLALYILLSSLQDSNFILSDVGKDILVAKHLSHNMTDSVFIRPNSTWANLPLTPVYFWLMALLYSIFSSPSGMLFGGVLIKITALLFIYLLGREMKSKQLGLLYLLLIGFSSYFIHLPLNPFLFISLFFFLGFYSYIKSWLHLSVFFIFLCCSIHISAIVILPSFFYLWVKKSLKSTDRKHTLLLIVGITLFSLALFFLTYLGESKFFLSALKNGLTNYQNHKFDIVLIARTLFGFFLRKYPLTLALLLPSCIYLIHTKHCSHRVTFLTILGSVGLFFIIPFAPERPIRIEYIQIPLLACTLAVGYWINTLLVGTKNHLFTAAVVGICAAINLQSIMTFEITRKPSYTYRDSREIAQMITRDNTYSRERKLKIVLPFYGFGGLPNISDYFSPGIWYSMEQSMSQQLITIVDAHSSKQSNNIAGNNTFDYILICIEDKTFTRKSCITDFQNTYPDVSYNLIGKYRDYTIYKSY